MKKSSVQIEASWYEQLGSEFESPYFQQLADSLKTMKADGKIIYPPGSKIFQAFNTTPFDQVKVIILGQDPYHNPGQAMGLSFSVPRDFKIPPSLVNIYKELKSDVGFTPPFHGDLSAWADRGVFLLNAILTVEGGRPASHSKLGWSHFTDRVITCLSERRSHLVFLLWGNFAKQKKNLIDTDKHLVLEAAHPSPLAGNAFSGCRHFSQTNAYLKSHGIPPIDWQL
jgi:uracil-DNA glycosylase